MRLIGLAAVCVAAWQCGVASAADAVARYPERSIRLLIGFPPGGGTDALARIIAPKLAESLGTQWVVDNRGGAGGNLATEIVARAQPDGYTLLLSLSTSLTVNPSLYGKLPFDVLRDLQPIIMLAEYDHILVVHAASVPAASLKEFIALAKSKPGSLNYSSSGIGGTPHMAAELFKHRAEVNLTHVPYKGGGPAAAAVLAGEVQVMFGTFPSLLPHTKSGRLRALATTGTKRSPLTPELPTIAESGFPGFEATGWIGLLAPAKTPQPIIKVLHSEALKALALPEVQEALSRQGLFESTTSSPAQFTAYIKQETQTWTRIIKSAGIRAE